MNCLTKIFSNAVASDLDEINRSFDAVRDRMDADQLEILALRAVLMDICAHGIASKSGTAKLMARKAKDALR